MLAPISLTLLSSGILILLPPAVSFLYTPYTNSLYLENHVYPAQLQ